MPLPVAPPVPATEYDAAADRVARRRERAVRRTLTRSRWWWAPTVAVLVVLGLWGVLRADQFLSGALVWPRQGARFVEISDGLPPTSGQTGGPITVVISGLNTKSGTAVATALLPALTRDGGRVFSLVYGSGIADEDLVTKYDALVDSVRPREVTFFGSSMGGDIALNLAAHAHRLREEAKDDQASSVTSPDSRFGGTLPPLAASGGGAGVAAADAAADPAAADDPHGIGNLTGSWAATLPGKSPAEGIDAGAATGDAPSDADPSVTGSGQAATGSAAPVGTGAPGTALPPRVRAVYLDCTPLAADDVRDRSRTSADLLTGLTEAAGTDGGAATRVAVEVLIQRRQWSSGLLPTVTVRWDDLWFKYDQVMREKIRSPGISTSLVKDQYGVIRRMNADARFADLADGTEPVRIVYFRPVDASSDTVVAVERVTRELGRLAADHALTVRVVGVEGGHHASAQSDPGTYLAALGSPFPGRVISADPGDVTMLAVGQR